MLRHSINWLTTVYTSNPLRKLLNRGLAVVIIICIFSLIPVVAALALAETPSLRIFGTALLIPGFVINWWINRHGTTQGAVIMTVLMVLAIFTAVDIQKYLTPWGQPIIIDIALICPTLIGAFFLSPWSAIWVAVIEASLICLEGMYMGLTNDRVINFAVFGPLTLVPIAALIALLAQMYQNALILSFDENARLAKLLHSDEYTLDHILATMDESGDHLSTP